MTKGFDGGRAGDDSWRRAQEIFNRAVSMPVDQRPAFLDQSCAGDSDLRREVAELLAADGELVGQAQDFIAATVAAGEHLLTGDGSEPPVPKSIGKYSVESRLGRGGFGVVYRGYDPLLQRPVAIKVCTGFDAELRRRFYREGQIAAGLRHQNITEVYELSVENGMPYLVQELLDGEDLRQVIQEGRPPSLVDCLGLLMQVGRGLAFAHQAGVLHRDIKPANIRLLPDRRVKIMDFGIAKVLGAETGLTVTGSTVGTVGYLAPEQLRSETLDGRADIFSFGVVAYELLSGRRPFLGGDFSQVSYQLLYQDPPALLELQPDCPWAVANLVHRCLNKEKSGRPADFSAVVAELQTIRGQLGEQFQDPLRPTSQGVLSTETGASEAGPALGRSTTWARLTAAEARPLWGLALAVVALAVWIVIGQASNPRSARPPASVHSSTPGESTSSEESQVLGPQVPSAQIPSAQIPSAQIPSAQVPSAQGPDSRTEDSPVERFPAQELPEDAGRPVEPQPSTEALNAPDSKIETDQVVAESPLDLGDLEATGSLTEASESSDKSGIEAHPVSPEQASLVGDSDLESAVNPGAEGEGELRSISDGGQSSVQPATSRPSGGAGEAIPDHSVAEQLGSEIEEGLVESANSDLMSLGDLITSQGPGITAPELLHKPTPRYPRRARRRQIEGRVVVKVLVDEKGRVLQALASGDDPHGFLAAAREAALGAEFEPAVRDGIAGRMWTHLPFDFTLQ